MASSSGNSNSSSRPLPNSGSEDDLRVLMDQRKRKRMLSNRESARRSRMRKQKKVDELMAEAVHLKKENGQILTTVDLTTQHLLSLDAENSVLRAQVMELNQQLHSLNDILSFINLSNNSAFGVEAEGVYSSAVDPFLHGMFGVNQPIVAAAAADVFQDW